MDGLIRELFIRFNGALISYKDFDEYSKKAIDVYLSKSMRTE